MRRARPSKTARGNSDPIFCADRVWDHGTEAGFFRSIENAFNDEVERIFADGRVTNHLAVTEYFSIWYQRGLLAKAPPADAELADVLSSTHLTKEQEEILESKGAIFMRDRHVLGRFDAGLRAKIEHDRTLSQLHATRWGVLRWPGDRRVICGNQPGAELFIPLSPNIILAGGLRDGAITSAAVERINRVSWANADFVFGHPASATVIDKLARSKIA